MLISVSRSKEETFENGSAEVALFVDVAFKFVDVDLEKVTSL